MKSNVVSACVLKPEHQDGPENKSVPVFVGFPVIGFLLPAVISPMLFAMLGLVYGGWADAWEGFLWLASSGVPMGIGVFIFILIITLSIWFSAHGKRAANPPVRFNRQKREVCLVPKGEKSEVMFPWEDVVAWVVEVQAITQYGSQKHYGVGIGLPRKNKDEMVNLEFSAPSLDLGLGIWEAVRGFMEYEIHSLDDINCYDDSGVNSQYHGTEGLEKFSRSKKELQDKCRLGDTNLLYVVGWYVFNLVTLWSIPNRLVEWEVKKLRATGRAHLPSDMEDWSRPLPESQWEQPSEELVRQTERVRQLLSADPQRPITEIFAQVSEEFVDEKGLLA